MTPVDWLLLGSVIAVVALALYHLSQYPKLNPYFRKYGWLLLIPVAIIVGFAVVSSRRKPASPPGAAAGDAARKMGTIVDQARAASAEADVELTRRRLEAQVIDDADVAKLAEFDSQVRQALEESDAAVRRQRLIELVEESKS